MYKWKTIDASSLKRIAALVILAFIFWIVLFLRLFQIQIISRGKYVEKARNQYIQQAELKPERGLIMDRKFRSLAINRPTWSLGIDIIKISHRETAADQFAKIFHKDRNYFLEQFKERRNFLWLARGVNEETVNEVEALKIPGLRVIKESKRYYPQNKVGAHLIGFTDIDRNGLSGIELIKNKTLQGRDGFAVYQKDALGKTMMDINYPIKKPVQGQNVILTIDNTYQWIAQEEMDYVVATFEAEAATVIIMNPATGEILAMAVKPDFDPNQAGSYAPSTWRNRAITDSYEPGSTFKPIIMSAVLEEGLKTPDDMVFCENGKYKIYDRVIEDVKGYGWLTVHKVIQKSSNIGMAKIAKELNRNLIFQYLRDFGFGMRTGIELPGEASGELKPTAEWSKFTAIGMSYGYGISVTPLQLVMAFAAIANGGFLLKPQIVLGTAKDDEHDIDPVEPQVIRRVISERTAKTIRSMLEDVVVDGTAKAAAVPGLAIAGKTGTTKKYDPYLRRYTDDKFISSFIGFYPTQAPKLLIYVMVDNPRKGYLGGEVAAPAFRRILQRILRAIEIEKQSAQPPRLLAEQNPSGAAGDDNGRANGSSKGLVVPNFINKRIEAAEEIADWLDLKLVLQNEGEIVMEQYPAPGTRVDDGAEVAIKMKNFNGDHGRYAIVPSVVGLTLRDAVARLSQTGLRVVLQGSGRVVRQTPSAGSRVRVGSRCELYCESVLNVAEYRTW